MEVGDKVEHINKESKSKYPHDKIYTYIRDVRMKDISSGQWFDAVEYSDGEQYFIRWAKDFFNNFKKVE